MGGGLPWEEYCTSNLLAPPFINDIHTYNLARSVPCVFVIKMVYFGKDLDNFKCFTIFIVFGYIYKYLNYARTRILIKYMNIT